jgi:hypothetical protein
MFSYHFIYDKDAQDVQPTADDVVGRMQHLSKKMRRHCKSIIKDLPYTQLVVSLDAFTGLLMISLNLSC